MRIIFFIAFLCTALQAISQHKIAGKISAANNEAIIYQVKVEYVHSTKVITGSFYEPYVEIPLDSIGEIVLTVTSGGYETYQARKTLQPSVNDLGEIILYKDIVQLKEVVVKAVKSEIQHDGANYTIRNIRGTHIGDAGNLADMLKWTPGLIVSGADEINVAGAGPAIIYINGRKITNRTELLMLSSTEVSKIEVIREPDARYKNGTNAVVNIYLKKQLKDLY
ncbi:MAG: hypothetical protein LBU44_06005 [Mediterranea sp.]|nr:hypothetical protein [Mediterranea sp.]